MVNYLEVVEGMQFEITGHSTGFGIYPYFVDPVGFFDGIDRCVFLRFGKENKVFAQDISYSHYVPLNDEMKERFSDFDYSTHGLFAYTPDDIVFFDIDKELDFKRELLAGDRFPDTYHRMHFAQDIDDYDLLLTEAAKHIKVFDGKFLDNPDLKKDMFEQWKEDYLVGTCISDIAKRPDVYEFLMNYDS